MHVQIRRPGVGGHDGALHRSRAGDTRRSHPARHNGRVGCHSPRAGENSFRHMHAADVGRLGLTPMQVALAWLLHRSPNILLIPGTSSVAHLRENLAAGELTLSPETLEELNGIAAAATKH